jgi:hypothetical protein
MTTQPRDDGSIVDWSKLDEKQRAAALKAHALFASMAEVPNQKPPPTAELFSFLPRLDAFRRNHVVLIDGARGSGKTAVMLRLLKDWTDNLTGKPESETLNFKLQNDALLVPVGLLDLEAVPQHGNLATRLAGMFERVIAAMERRGAKDDRTPSAPAWALPEGDTLKSREKWRHFVNAAALEWDRSLERRRASIDPDAYAVEVEQAETKGLQARTCFREFIDSLVEDWQRSHARRATWPFFIVPIDDADLNPGRVVEMFGLLRTLWHPRVGYLLTGHSELFERVLTTHFRVQLDMPVLGGATTGGWFRVQLLPDPEHAAERLARDYYHKAISLENCLKLRRLDGRTRLEFIKDALPEDLIDYLDADEISPLALPGRWRELKDLRDYCVQFKDSLTPSEFAFQLWKDAFNDAQLGKKELEDLREAVRFDRELRFDNARAPLIVPSAQITESPRSSDEDSIAQVHVNLGHRYRGFVGDTNGLIRLKNAYEETGRTDGVRAGVEYPNSLPALGITDVDESIVAAYMVALNVAHGNCRGPLLLWSTATSKNMRLPYSITLRWWPPRSERLYDTQLLLREWNAQASQCAGDMEQLAKCYLRLALRFVFEYRDNLDQWRNLARAVVERFDLGGIHANYAHAWCTHAAGLAAPEWGLPPEVANKWLAAIMECAAAAGKWHILREKLASGRVGAIQQSYMRGDSEPRTDKFEEIAKGTRDEINRQARKYKYDWETVVESAPKSLESGADASISVKTASPRPGTKRKAPRGGGGS